MDGFAVVNSVEHLLFVVVCFWLLVDCVVSLMRVLGLLLIGGWIDYAWLMISSWLLLLCSLLCFPWLGLLICYLCCG